MLHFTCSMFRSFTACLASLSLLACMRSTAAQLCSAATTFDQPGTSFLSVLVLLSCMLLCML